MPALTVTVGMKGEDKVAAGLEAISAKSKTVANRLKASYGEQTHFILQQMQALQKSGIVTGEAQVQMVAYEAELAAVTAQMAALNVQTAALAATQTVQANATKAGVFAGANWRRVFGEMIVIFRELAAGRGLGRVAASVTYLAQNLLTVQGLIGLLLRPITTVIAGLAYAGYKLISWSLEMVHSAQAMSTSTEELTARFKGLASALETASMRAHEFHNWLNDLRVGNESVTEGVDEQIRALRERFQLQQQLAQERGQTPQERARAEIEQLKAEQEIVRKSIEEIAPRAERAKKLAIKHEAEANNPNLDTTIAGEKAIQSTQSEIYGAVAAEFKRLNPELSATELAHNSYAMQRQNEDLDVTVGGKKLSISLKDSLATINAITSQLSTHELQKKEADELAKESAEQAKKLSDARIELDKKNSALSADIKLKEEFLPQVADAAEKHERRREAGLLTSNQHVGAFISPGTVSIIDKVTSIHSELKGIHKTIKENGEKSKNKSDGGFE